MNIGIWLEDMCSTFVYKLNTNTHNLVNLESRIVHSDVRRVGQMFGCSCTLLDLMQQRDVHV